MDTLALTNSDTHTHIHFKAETFIKMFISMSDRKV